MTEKQQAEIMERVIKDCIRHDPYWDRFQLASLVLEAAERFLPPLRLADKA